MSSSAVISRLTCYSHQSRVNSALLLLRKSYSQRLIQPLLLPSMVIDMNKRWASNRRKRSRFPQEDGMTRLEKLNEKLNPYDRRVMATDIPFDVGMQPDSVGKVFSDYIPKSGKAPGQLWEAAKAKLKSTYAIATIKRKESKSFKVVEFAQQAQKKFIDLNNDLQLKRNKSIDLRMAENATLILLKTLSEQFEHPGKKIYWRFVKEIERPRVVNAAVARVKDETDLYAQVTVRMNTEQILAIRDRYDRLIVGSLKNPKKVTDYVVLERHLADPYGSWRICGKING